MPEEHRPLPSGTGVAEAASEHTRVQPIAALIDHCIAAQTIADAQGEKFLSYMLAMTIEAARGLRRGRKAR